MYRLHRAEDEKRRKSLVLPRTAIEYLYVGFEEAAQRFDNHGQDGTDEDK
jgi:hypothetical protein